MIIRTLIRPNLIWRYKMKIVDLGIISLAIIVGIILVFTEPTKSMVWLWLFVAIISRLELLITRK